MLCAIILREDHANALTACDLLADVLMWNKTLGADLAQNEIHQLVQSLVNCVETTESVGVCLHFLQAIGTRCSPSIESFLLLLFALMNAEFLDDACQVSILEVLRTIVNNEMYVQVMSMAPYLSRFFGIVELWRKTPQRLADLLQLNKSVLTNKTCVSTLINCNGIPLFTDLAKSYDVEALLTPVFCVLASGTSSKNAVPVFLNHKCLDRVYEVMEKYVENQELQVACCTVLLNVANTRGGVTSVMQARNYVPAIRNLSNSTDEYYEVCCSLLNVLSHDSVNHYKLIEAGAGKSLLQVLSEHVSDEIADIALNAVKNFIQNPEIVPSFTEKENLEVLCAAFPVVRGQAQFTLCDVLLLVLGEVKEFPSPVSTTIADTIVSLTAEKAREVATMQQLVLILKNVSLTPENRVVMLESGFVNMVFDRVANFIANRDLVLLLLSSFEPYWGEEVFAQAVMSCKDAGVIVPVMSRYTTVTSIQSVAIKTLLATAQFIPEAITELQATVVCIRCIQLCISDDLIVLDGCRTLLFMVADAKPETAVASRQSVVTNGGLEPFYTTLQRYPKNAAIVEVILRALRFLADGSSDVNRIASAPYLRTLMLVYSNFSNNADLTTLFVQLICSLSAIESCKAAIIQSGIIAKTVQSTQTFPEAHELLFAVAGAISNLALKGTSVCEAFHKFSAESVLLAALKTEGIPADTAILIATVLPLFFQIKSNPEFFVKEGGVDAFLRIAAAYPEDVMLHGVFVSCLSVLSSALSLRPAIAKDEVLDFVLASLQLCATEEEYVVRGMTLFSVAVENDAWIRAHYETFFDAVILVMQSFPQSYDVAVASSQLCLVVMDYLWEHGVQYYMKNAGAEAEVAYLQYFINNKDVVVDCCGVLNRCQVVDDETQLSILTTISLVMNSFSKDAKIHLAIAEMLLTL